MVVWDWTSFCYDVMTDAWDGYPDWDCVFYWGNGWVADFSYFFLFKVVLLWELAMSAVQRVCGLSEAGWYSACDARQDKKAWNQTSLCTSSVS